MSEPFIGEIRIWAINYAPANWAYCNGATLQIIQNQALYAVIGTTYGGDGSTTFALPNLIGRAPLHVGGTQNQGTGLSARALGESGGASTVTLNSTNLPAHNHTLRVAQESGNNTSPAGGYIASDSVATDKEYAANTNPLNAPLNSAQLASTGGGQAHNNMQPSLALNFCIALNGIYPSPF